MNFVPNVILTFAKIHVISLAMSAANFETQKTHRVMSLTCLIVLKDVCAMTAFSIFLFINIVLP